MSPVTNAAQSISSGDQSASLGAERAKLTPAEVLQLERLGFELLSVQYRAPLETQYVVVKHRQSGAHAVLLQNDDPHLRNRLLFKTYPPDDSGIFHVMEHSVLAGSPDLQVADAFDEMYRSLIITDLNATTDSGITDYYVAGIDPYSVSLMTKVFLGAVLKGAPSLDIFLRECGHLKRDPENPDRLKFSGVVYGEMKGNFSSSFIWSHNAIKQALFPGSPYGRNSGGHPEAMFSLTPEQFALTNHQYYHSARMVAGMYGATSLIDKLEFLAENLASHTARPDEVAVPAPVVFTEPRKVEAPIPANAEPGRPLETQHEIVLGWKFPRPTDPVAIFEHAVLRQLLGKSELSPFAQAISNAKLGNAYAGCSSELTDNQVAVTLSFNTSTREHLQPTVQAVFQSLEKLVSEGVPVECIEAILDGSRNSFEKARTSPSRNQSLLNQALYEAMRSEWQIDPRSTLELIDSIRGRMRSGEPVFENLIRSCFLENNDRVELLLVPDADLIKKMELTLARQSDELVARMGPEEVAEAWKIAEKLESLESKRAELGNLSLAPKATLDPAYRKHTPVDKQVEMVHGAEFLFTPQETATKAELYLGFDVAHLSCDELLALDFLATMSSKLGTAGSSPGAFQQALANISTGIQPHTAFHTVRREGDSPLMGAKHGFRSQCDVDRTGEFARLLLSPLLAPPLDQLDRMLELGQGMTSSFATYLNHPHYVRSTLTSALGAVVSPYDYVAMADNPYVGMQSWQIILKGLRDDPEMTRERLAAVARKVFDRANLVVHCTARAQDYPAIREELESAVLALPVGVHSAFTYQFNPGKRVHWGVDAGLSSNFVGMVAPFDKGEFGYGTALVASHIIARHLNSEVRKKGGAYGAVMAYTDDGEYARFFSWQDPHIEHTLEAFRGAPEFLRSAGADLLDRAKVAAMRMYITADGPFTLGQKAFNRHIGRIPGEFLDAKRAEIFDASLAEMRAFADRLDLYLRERSSVIVMGSRRTLADAEALGLSILKREQLVPAIDALHATSLKSQ